MGATHEQRGFGRARRGTHRLARPLRSVQPQQLTSDAEGLAAAHVGPHGRRAGQRRTAGSWRGRPRTVRLHIRTMLLSHLPKLHARKIVLASQVRGVEAVRCVQCG